MSIIYLFFVQLISAALCDSNSDSVDSLIQLITKETSRAYTIPPTLNSYQFTPKSKKYIEYGTFDHIIVGSGSSGAIVARRLAEDGTRQVLLLEAGGNTTEFSKIPAMAAFLGGLEQNWNYISIPQKTSCLGMIGQQCFVHSGKVLGGSSTINALVYTRGSKQDYDKWALEGNYGWSYNDVLPYFKKFENHNSNNLHSDKMADTLSIETFQAINKQTKAFFQANKELGRKEVDYNKGEQIGFGRTQFNTLKGRRQDIFTTFVTPILKKPNLKVLINSFVIKVLINDHKRAFGVLFTRNGKIYVAKSRQDIVISAGAVNSPKLLMLSGLGPKTHLEELGINVVQDLPVGENLIDHPTYAYLEFLTNFTAPVYTLEKLVKGYIASDGSLSNSFNLQALAFLQSNLSTGSGQPDIEIAFLPSVNSNPITYKYFNTHKDTIGALTKIDEPEKSVYCIITNLHPKSRGFVRLKSANPFDYPLIHLNMLADTDNEDIKILYQGIQMALEIMNTNAFKKLDVKLKPIVLRQCEDVEYLSQDYWYCQLRHLTMSLFHLVGTCKMGQHPKLGAVVNPELKVFGIHNLRVADASIMPSSISGNTNAPSIMIGERAADLIKGIV